MLEKYTDENVYWFTIEETVGQRMEKYFQHRGYLSGLRKSYPATVDAEESHWWKTTLSLGRTHGFGIMITADPNIQYYKYIYDYN